ncbi:venom protease-like [Panulirus ornatus]|uniref:venom protease-like n=1 Tax=Panulirus ornatus TaxID=150431 RepID=UPI003A895822
MGENFPVSTLLLVLVGVANVWAQDLVFEENPPDACTPSTGGRGQCVSIQSCTAVLDTVHQTPPVHCGFDGATPVVCCPVSEENDSNPLLDTSTPVVSFDCGQNAVNSVKLHRFSVSAGVLRPEAINHATNRSNVATQERPRSRPGIPDKAIEKVEAALEAQKEEGIRPAIGAVDADKNAWPWMALLGEEDPLGITWFCGGVLINDQWVLSALHCFFRKNANVVRLGEHDYNDQSDGADHEDFGVSEIIWYSDYTHPEAYHDLALLKLDKKVTLKKYVSPVCLPWGKDVNTDLTGRNVTLTGWGDTLFNGFPSSILQEVNVTVFPSSRCDASYSNLVEYSRSWPRGIGNETICAGDPNGGRDACQGDSGGPIVYLNSAGRYTLAGIVSRGFGCGLKDYPGLYVNLHQPNYLAWIKKVAF